VRFLLSLPALSLLLACGGPKVDRPDAAFIFDDAGTEPPTTPRLDEVPVLVPWPVVTVRGRVDQGERVMVQGVENPLVTSVLPASGEFCIDVPLRSPGSFDLSFRAQGEGGDFSAPAMATVQFDPSAPEIPGATTCSGGDPRGCSGSAEICDNFRDDDCNGFTDDRDPACQTCEDDFFEPNDTTPAPMIEVGRHDGLKACGDDGDYYAFELEAGATILARIFFSHSGGDIDLFLIGPGGSTLTSSESSDDDESLMFTSDTGGLHHVYVVGATTLVDNEYVLDVSVTTP